MPIFLLIEVFTVILKHYDGYFLTLQGISDMRFYLLNKLNK